MSAASAIEAKEPARSERNCAIEEQARAALRRSPYPQLRRVECKYEAGVITLQGDLPSYYSLQLALSLVRSELDGDILIRNQLDVDVPVLHKKRAPK